MSGPSEPKVGPVDEALESIRSTVERQLGSSRVAQIDIDPASLVRFSPDLPDEFEPGERERLEAAIEELQPWLQGPFLVGGDLIVGGAWRNDQRWEGLAKAIPDDLGGLDVLDVGSNAGYDPFMFKLLGARRVTGVEPYAFMDQALFLESIFHTGAEFVRAGWQDLDPDSHGVFDLVHCHGVLYHELSPMALLAKLWEMTKPGGMLLLGSMMLSDPTLSEHARFVPRDYYEDETWWWVPGRLALRWMIECSGFDVEFEFGTHDGPPGQFPTVNGYIRASRTSRLPSS